MSRVQRLRRRRAGAHERARALAAQRLDAPLTPADGAWLEEHLAGCDACRSVAASYEADRLALRAMRDRQPEAPRDLWARTSAAIERESSARGGASRHATGSSRRPRPALGVLSGVAVIAVVIGATVLSGGFSQAPSTAIVPPASQPPVAIASTPATPDATPFAVPAAGSVRWVGTSANGALAYNVAKVDEVCPVEGRPDCPTVSDDDSRHVDISIRPKSISKSPVNGQAVVVGEDAKGDDAVFVIALPTAEATATPTPKPTPKPTPASTPRPTATIEPSPSVEPTASSSDVVPSATPDATPEATPKPTAEPTPEPTPVSTPVATPTPTSAIPTNLAIVKGVKVVGESAAYSPDGAWFAFTEDLVGQWTREPTISRDELLALLRDVLDRLTAR